MAVFLSAADESKDNDTFFYGGWAGPFDVWENFFAPAWNERVLNGPPRIPYLHMTEIRDWDGQREHGLTPWQADRRVDAAADVLRSTGSLVPVSFELSRADFNSMLRQRFTPRVGQQDTFEPDYLCFQYFAMSQLDMLHQRFGSEVEQVHFWVEENGKISRHMHGFRGRRFGLHGDIDADALREIAEAFANSPEAWRRPPWHEGEAE